MDAERGGDPFALVVLPDGLAQDAADGLIRSIRNRPRFNATHLIVLAASGLETAAWSRFGGWPSCVVVDADEQGAGFELAILSALAGFRARRLRARMQAGVARHQADVEDARLERSVS